METITIEETTALLTNGKITLQPSQAKICFPIIERIFKKMILGIQFQGIKIAGNVIIDGHHRYIASLLAEVSLEEFPTKKTSATQIFTWPSVDIVVND